MGHMVADVVDDLTDGALPNVLKPYVGVDGTGEWMEHIESNWEMTNMVISNPIVGLRAGCVTMSMTFDLKHKGTGKRRRACRCGTSWRTTPRASLCTAATSL